MSASERRAEIMRILTARRSETMNTLAAELGVTSRTIRSDISELMVNYPLETRRGNGGHVGVVDGYNPYRNILTEEQQRVLLQIIPIVDGRKAKVLRELLNECGSPKYGSQVS